MYIDELNKKYPKLPNESVYEIVFTATSLTL